MYPLLVLALGIVLTLFMDGVAAQYRDLTQRYQSRSQQMQLVSLAENIEQFYVEHAAPPPTVDALASSAGFEQVRGYTNRWQQYGVSPVLTDATWRFTRAVLFTKDPTGGTTAANYLADNACGAGGFDTAVSWCGSKDSRWFRLESRERYAGQIVTQRARMTRMLQKLSDHYNANGGFPAKDNLGTDLAIDSVTKLTTLVGYAGTAANCSGTFNYMGVPVDCGDLFDLWGAPVGYQFLSKKRVMLTSESPIYDAAGSRVVVVAEYDYTLIN